jgi:hypothetical protein
MGLIENFPLLLGKVCIFEVNFPIFISGLFHISQEVVELKKYPMLKNPLFRTVYANVLACMKETHTFAFT